MGEVAKYLEAEPGERNRFEHMPIETSGLYCGGDSMFSLRLSKKQERLMRAERLQKAYELFHNGSLAFAQMELEGIRIDVDKAYEWEKDWKTELYGMKDKILTCDDAKAFEKKKGRPMRYVKKLSGDDLQVVLFDILKIKPLRGTERKKGWAVDEDALRHYAKHCELLRWELKARKLATRSNFLGQILRCVYDGFIYPTNNLHLPRSYRSSNSDPSFQNFPKHEELMAIIRELFIPREGNWIWTVDYGGHELRIIACVTKCGAMIEYVVGGKDIHSTLALKIFGILGITERSEIFKQLRQVAKNQCVFPLCYGSYFVSIAKNIWNDPTIISLGVLDDFYPSLSLKQRKEKWEQHVKSVEKWFWKVFRGVRRWQDNYIKSYQKYGFARDLSWGFKRRGYLSRNKLYNFPIQGPAFHCLLWSIIEIMKWKHEYESKLCGQIHDDLFWDMKPSESGEIRERVDRVMTEEVREANPWIIVPLETEWKKGLDWLHMKDVK